MKRQRRQFGKWQLYTSRPVTLGCKPYGTPFIYHMPEKNCQTQEGYDDWVAHFQEKFGDYDIPNFQLAIRTLRAEGKYLKPIG